MNNRPVTFTEVMLAQLVEEVKKTNKLLGQLISMQGGREDDRPGTATPKRSGSRKST
jgi:hypothetical protein